MNVRNAAFRQFFGMASALTCIFMTMPAHAQSALNNQTSIANPGRVEGQQLQRTDELTRPMPQIDVKEIQIENAPPGAEKIRFTLDTLKIEGSTAYSQKQLTTVYKDKIGQTISLADLYGIAGDLTRKYRNDGYVLTQVIVPPQTIEGGTARLQVVEGYVGNVAVQTDDNAGGELVREYASHIKSEGGALNVKDLERWMLMINDIPGLNARGILSPSPTTPGAADLTIVYDRKDYDALVGLDNYGSRYLGPTQATFAGSLNSMLGMNERITGQFVTTPMGGFDPELAYMGFAYEQPIFNAGTVVEFFGSKTLTDPGWDLEEFDVKGKSDLLGFTVRHPFIRTRNVNLTGRAGFDYRNVETKNNIEPTRNDRIRAFRTGGRFEILDTLLGAAYNTVDLDFSRGLDILGSSDDDSVNISRPEADPDFFKMNAEIQRLQRITSSVNLFGSVAGQWANDALYSTEEFGVGGINYGRGYEPSEIIGDDGVAAKVELQWNTPYKLSFVDNIQLFGFYDFGKVWNKDATTSEGKTNSLASTGVGFRTDLAPQVNAGFAVALPLTREVQTEGDQSPRFLFSINKRF